MRRVRITIGLAAAALALSLLASPAFAAKKEKEKLYFGEFTASIAGRTISGAEPAMTKGKGEVETLKLAGKSFTCEKEMTAKGEVTAERSPNFTTAVKLVKCYYEANEGGGLQGKKYLRLKTPLILEFHANGSATAGSGEGDVIIHEDSVDLSFSGSKCNVLIPYQSIPTTSGTNPEKQYESASYSTEKEAVEGGKLKKYPSGFHETLEITLTLKHIKTDVKPNETCTYKKEEEGNYNPETGYVEYSGGELEGELVEQIPGGNLGFEAPTG